MINAIDIIAAREGKKPEEIREAIQEALELAWASGDSNHIQARKKLTDSPTAPNLPVGERGKRKKESPTIATTQMRLAIYMGIPSSVDAPSYYGEEKFLPT